MDLRDDLKDTEDHLQEGDDQIVDVLDVVELEEGFHLLQFFFGGEAIAAEDLNRFALGFDFGLQDHEREDEADHIEGEADAGGDDGDETTHLEEHDVDDDADEEDGDESDRAEVDERSQDDSGLHVGIALFIQDGERGLLSAHREGRDRSLADGPSAKTDFLEVVGVAVSEEERAEGRDADVLQSVVVQDPAGGFLAIEASAVLGAVIDHVFDGQPNLDDAGEDRDENDESGDDDHCPEDARAYIFEALDINKEHSEFSFTPKIIHELVEKTT